MLEGGEEVNTDVGRRLSLGLRLGELVNKVSVEGDPLLLLKLFCTILGVSVGPSSILLFRLRLGRDVAAVLGLKLGDEVASIVGEYVG